MGNPFESGPRAEKEPVKKPEVELTATPSPEKPPENDAEKRMRAEVVEKLSHEKLPQDEQALIDFLNQDEILQTYLESIWPQPDAWDNAERLRETSVILFKLGQKNPAQKFAEDALRLAMESGYDELIKIIRNELKTVFNIEL